MKAYSYIRWSSDPQTQGDSLKRQLEATRKICQDQGWALDETLRPDQGISAYAGSNLEKGSLAKFLAWVKSGRIETPCILVVEALDRLTRTRLRDARKLLDGLLEKSVRICTAHNAKIYDEASLDNPLDLIISLMELNAAHQYSAAIGRRVAAAWATKKRAAANGTILTKMVPSWLTADRNSNTFEINQKKAAIVRRIFKAYLAGKGIRLIMRELNRDKIPAFKTKNGWSTTHIRRLLSFEGVIGQYQPHKHLSRKKRVPEGQPIEGYYPPILDKATFYGVQERLKLNPRIGGSKSKVTNLFSGLVKCSKCGSTMVLKDASTRKYKYTFLVCSKALRGNGCKYKTVKYEPLERGLLTAIWARVLPHISEDNSVGDELLALQGDLKHVESKIDRINKMIVGEDDQPRSLLKMLSDLESKQAELKQTIAALPTKSESKPLYDWNPVSRTPENRLMLQSALASEIERIVYDAETNKALVYCRGCAQVKNGVRSPLGFPIAFDRRDKESFLLMGQKQRFLDDVLVWKSAVENDSTAIRTSPQEQTGE